jgi:ribonuclease PH
MSSQPDSHPLRRTDGRAANELRPVTWQANIAPYATGSVLIRFGNTQVICAATLENKVPRWMQAQGVKGGWITAEYAMLPYSTLDRKARDISKGKQDGRSIEIQRLIGRAVRAVVDLKLLDGYTLWLDCDVLQADGGTRTAAITGAQIAAKLAVRSLNRAGKLAADPFRDSVAAVSVGVLHGQALLDLCYEEDRAAQVDANIVMTGSGQFVELQVSGEEATFSAAQYAELIALASAGIAELTTLQNQAIAESAP